MVIPTFTKKEKLETGENFEEEIVVWVFDTLSLSCLSDSLVQLFSTSYKCKHEFRRNVWTGGIV